ncbi:MAG: hypothetical protein ACRD0L_15670 [Acidimicrobiales bacterium]
MDAHFLQIDDAWEEGGPLGVAAGIGLAMVLTHDCQLDKEWNQRVRELERGGTALEPAEREATADATLDRTLVVSPLVDPSDLRGGRGNLLAGRVIGYVPVPKHPEDLVEECVADLTYQCTVDRLDVIKVASITESARKQLRYALIQLDALRTADLGFQIEAVIGRTIHTVDVSARDPLTVRIQLDDGQVIQLLQQPGSPDQESGRSGEFFSSGGTTH